MLSRNCISWFVFWFFAFLSVGASWLWADEPTVSNVVASQRTDGSMLVDIEYDLAGTDAQYQVLLKLSQDGDNTYTALTHQTGNVGRVEPGTSKQVVWNLGLSIRRI